MRSLTAVLIGAAVVAAADVGAQTLDPDRAPQRQPRTTPSSTFGGIDVMVAQPLGDFNDYIDVGGGIGAHVIQQLGRSGALAARFDLGYINYGSERHRFYPFPRIAADIVTTNSIFFAGVGPQLMVPSGRFRPYVAGSVGLSYFFTQSSLEGLDDYEYSTLDGTNYDDLTFAWGGAAGLYIPVKRGLRPISIDVGVRYHANGRAKYLREGSISDGPDNRPVFTPIESQTNLLTYQLGATFGF